MENACKTARLVLFGSSMERSDLSNLAVFATVAEHLSFRRAGHVLGISPSAVSHAVRGLEERLHVPLFARTRAASP